MRSLVHDMPAVGWLITATIVVRTLLLSLVIIGVGTLVDSPSTTTMIWVVGAAVCAGAVMCLESVLPQRLRARQEASWRKQLAHRNFALDTKSSDHAQLITLATEGAAKASTYTVLFLGPFFAVFCAPLVVIISIGWAYSWVIAGILALGLCIVPFVITWARRTLKGAGAGYGRASAQLTGVFLESVRTLGTTLLLNATDTRRALIVQRAEKMRQEVMGLLYRNQLMILVTDGTFGLATTTVTAVVAVGGFTTGSLTLGQACALVLLSRLLIDPLNRMGRTFYTGLAGKSSLNAINQALALPHAQAPAQQQGQRCEGTIVLNHVSILRGKTTVIHDVSVEIAPGTHLAIVGPSGAGKSSLALALSGLLPFNGEISIGGLACTMADLRASISFVPQSPTLFSGTIAENIDLASVGVNTAPIHHLLLGKELPESHRVGETGQGVSGGQAARISMARGLAKEAQIMVLDEATANLDHNNAQLMRTTVRQLDCTLIEITHRPTEALDADLIMVMEDGQISVIDTPQNVLDQSNFFRSAVEEAR